MQSRRYLSWFFGIAGAIVALAVAFNAIADSFILHHRAGASVQLVSGFERVLKPVWLASIKPTLVFIGSSRARIAFDPTLVDPALHLKSFNYGVSSESAYEARRYIQDAAAQPNVKAIVVALDAFVSGSSAQPFGGGFDELRLAVTPAGQPTPRRNLWLFTSRYLSGGALGMHALGVWLLAQLGPGQLAQDRPDIFTEYGQMTPEKFRHELTRRAERTMHLTTWQHEQLLDALAAVCHSNAVIYFYFPPDNMAIIERYLANDAKGFADLKKTVAEDVIRHNSSCPNKAHLFDFMNRNRITEDDAAARGRLSTYYLDPIHIRPPTGILLLRRMLLGEDKSLGMQLVPSP
ncbi:MAG TPA: hypothetical protein VG891_01225 [Rhizomicrobium sp.]|nr:hypothetical protein [Rhizomicrobium sp.]